MTIRHSILTLTVAGLAWAAPAAQAHAVVGGDATSVKMTKSALSVMKAAGTRYHATGQSASTGVRPDDRSGIRGI
jgi:hypothetical protein